MFAGGRVAVRGRIPHSLPRALQVSQLLDSMHAGISIDLVPSTNCVGSE